MSIASLPSQDSQGQVSVADFLDGEGILLTRVSADWKFIQPTVEFTRFSVAIRASQEQGDRVGLILHELLENAVKYGGLGEDISVEIRLRPFAGFK
jgi:two-component sensor histidine kinase